MTWNTPLQRPKPYEITALPTLGRRWFHADRQRRRVRKTTGTHARTSCRTMSQSINLRAVRWAYEQDGLSATMKAVLMTFALHADHRGYAWPGVDHIAFTWHMDRKTVRRQITALIGKRTLYCTKARRGATGQVKVYRLPKITWESGAFHHRFKTEQSVPKESHKSPISGGERDPNNGIMKKEQKRTSHQGAAKIPGNSIPNASGNAVPASGFGSDGHQHQNQSARNHVKWPEFVAYCASQKGKPSKNRRHIHDGIPTEDGFRKWVLGQNFQWRNRVAPKFDGEDGYMLHDKFYTKAEANDYAAQHPEALEHPRFRAVLRRADGTIIPK